MPLRWDTRCRTGVTHLACASFFVGGFWYGYCTSNGYCELGFESAVTHIDLIVRPSQDSSSEIGIFNLEAIGCQDNIDSCSGRGTIRSALDGSGQLIFGGREALCNGGSRVGLENCAPRPLDWLENEALPEADRAPMRSRAGSRDRR